MCAIVASFLVCSAIAIMWLCPYIEKTSNGVMGLVFFICLVSITAIIWKIPATEYKTLKEGTVAGLIGVCISAFLFGVVLEFLKDKRTDKIETNRYIEEIDDYRHWAGAEAAYRIAGNIKRLARKNHSNVEDLDLSECNFANQNLSGINFQNCQMDKVSASFSNFEKNIFKNCSFVESGIRESHFEQATIIDKCKFDKSQIQEASFDGAIIKDAYFIECIGDRVHFNKKTDDNGECVSILTNVKFNGADLPGAKFQFAKLVDVEFKDANLSNADFSNSHLTGVDFSQASLIFLGSVRNESDDSKENNHQVPQSVNFTGATLERVTFAGLEKGMSNKTSDEINEAIYQMLVKAAKLQDITGIPAEVKERLS